VPHPADAPRPRILDVGCGIHKQPGAIGIDRNPATRADVLCDLDHVPYPFADNSFDRLLAIHVIEHVADVIATMEEFTAVSATIPKPGFARFRSASSYSRFGSGWDLNSW